MSWPRIFHRIWLDEPESPRFAAFRDRLAELHPGWEIRTWGDSSELTWLRSQALFNRYLETDPYGRVPDILRYELLWRFGGVYIDTDFEPLRPIDELLTDPRPFAAWENDRTMCTALLAAPAKHPAIDALITGLEAQCDATEDKTPNYATGPEWATGIWRARTDVRRLPPWTFYPVGWWEKERLGGPYPDRTYAVHHWARGWGEDKPNKRAGQPEVVVLVPWRSGDQHRELAWKIARRDLEQLGFPIVTADSEGEWNRAAAINAAAAAAGDWDVAIIADADTVDDHAALDKAIAQAHADGSAVVPFDTKFKLNREATIVSDRGSLNFDRRRDVDGRDPTRPKGPAAAKRGGTIVVSREAWDAVGGFDPGFIDWGHEDQAFRAAIGTLAPGGLDEISATSYHFWHPLAVRDRRGTPAGRARFAEYAEADGHPGQMAALLRRAGVL